ncbi:two-component system, NtrC family, sensor histidine kinase PilS [Thermotomaculum hydrothermale]|uniref:histidine kinase n=1 Tax=Thermotomaculum hydrothermale TaxID=981385 RepID=A0A7R6PE28_9BACT|nr:ATP-binding protein [Thermotomaculum hydrothermale]BBB31983.1 two-component system, NtrC family, sensor histidine kinase PilS [Thermotomaculum hydrothermale]
MIERRLINFYTSRLFTFLVFFLVIFIFNAFKEQQGKSILPVALAIVLYGVINFVYYRIKKLREKIVPILVLDAIFISLIVFFTGGVKSNFHILYLILIVFAGFYVETIHLYFLATVSVICFMLTVALTFFIHSNQFGLSSFYSISYPVAVYFVAIYAIALIITRINKRAKKLKYELIKKEKEIEKVTRLKNKIVDTITSGIITTDENLKINYINPQGENFLKKIYPDKKILGINLKELFPVHDFVDRLDFLDRYVVEIKDRLFGVSIVKLFSDNKFNGLLVVFQDLTEIKKMEKKAQFKDKMSELGELSASFAHEFRNSLASIKGAIQLLKEGKEMDTELIQVVENEINRLSNEINDFLRFARKDYQSPEYSYILPLIREIIEDFKTRLDKSIRFEYVEEIGEKTKVFFESVRLKKVFFNLLMNALKALEQAEEKKIVVRLYEKRQYIIFEVEDSGVGIKDIDKSKIFEPYYSGFSKGIGIGLALSKTFIDEMDGKIDFDSEEGKGSIFRVYLLKEGENGR